MPPKNSPRQRLALKRLETGLGNGQILPSALPADIYNSDPIIRAGYASTATFRSAFNRIRKKLHPNWNSNNAGMFLCLVRFPKLPMTFFSDVDSLKIFCAAHSSGAVVIGDDDDITESDRDEDDDIKIRRDPTAEEEPLKFKPMCAVSSWKEPRTRVRRISYAIILPSGNEPDGLHLTVIESGMVLQLSVNWPTVVTSIPMLLRTYLHSRTPGERISLAHPKVAGFEDFMSNLRRDLDSTISSTARFQLPFAVQSQIQNYEVIGWAEFPARVLLVDLRSDDGGMTAR